MTQYGVLSAWEATQAGFKIPSNTIESVTNWLLKTQDPVVVSDTREPSPDGWVPK